MFSPDILSANLAALTRAQGRCPALGPLPDFLRVAMVGNGVHVEARTADGRWQGVDEPSLARDIPSWLATGTVPAASQLVLVGAGLGYLLDGLASAPITRIVAIEPHPGLATLLLSRADWQRWFTEGRLRLLTGPEYEGAADVARALDGLQDISIVSHPLRAAIEPAVMERAVAVATRVAQNARANGNARRRFAGPYLLQTLGNLRAIAASADAHALDQQFAGRPAVVVGAGPSLDQNGPVLASLQDRAVIVTTDTALGPLLAHGVRPHLAVSVDSSALNASHLTSVAEHAGVLLACEGSVHPSSFAHFAGRTFTFRVSNHEPWPWLRTAGVNRGELPTWGSVLTSAFGLARRMGCDPIVFAGADLAFTGMRPYCRGTIYDAMWQEWIDRGCTWEGLMAEYFSRQPEMYRPDLRGDAVRTGPHLVSFRDWLVEQTTKGSGTFINATGGGILHGGRLQQQPLADALAGAASLAGVRETLAARHASFTANSTDLARIGRLLDEARTRYGRLPLARWKDFTVSTVSDEDIAQALGFAAAPA